MAGSFRIFHISIFISILPFDDMQRM